MDAQVLDDLRELINNSSEEILHVVSKTCRKRWMIETMERERECVKSVLTVRYDNNNNISIVSVFCQGIEVTRFSTILLLVKKGSFMIMFNTGDWQGQISVAYPKGKALWKKSYAECMVRSPWSYSFLILKPQSNNYTLHNHNVRMNI